MAQSADSGQAWFATLSELPERTRKALTQWNEIQQKTYEALGLDDTQWWAALEWALAHPNEEPEQAPEAQEEEAPRARRWNQRDTAAPRDEKKRDATAKSLVGGDLQGSSVTGSSAIAEHAKSAKPINQELFRRFLQERGKPNQTK